MFDLIAQKVERGEGLSASEAQELLAMMQAPQATTLEEAVKAEMAHLAEGRGLALSEEDLHACANIMLEQDWSSFNEWMSDVIEEYLNKKAASA